MGRPYINIMSCWQVRLQGQWRDFSAPENAKIQHAFQRGDRTLMLQARGQTYLIDFTKMIQKNTKIEPFKERAIRCPHNPPPGSMSSISNNNSPSPAKLSPVKPLLPPPIPPPPTGAGPRVVNNNSGGATPDAGTGNNDQDRVFGANP